MNGQQQNNEITFDIFPKDDSIWDINDDITRTNQYALGINIFLPLLLTNDAELFRR